MDPGSPPHTRGILQRSRLAVRIRGSPPRMRGIRPDGVADNGLDGITPAYAGNTNVAIGLCQKVRDHPRIRGEYINSCWSIDGTKGSPPHTRGIRHACLRKGANFGITPAYAGNTWTSRNSSPLTRDHPRIRGEYCISPAEPASAEGSPPHTRGIQR